MIELFKDRLKSYKASNAIEAENAVKEIIQEIALYALWEAGFFEVALFQGGTSLRILHGLPRFSEDLDFLLRVPNSRFDWAQYTSPVEKIFSRFGLKLEIISKNKMDTSIRQAIIKNDSIANQLEVAFEGNKRSKSIIIKLEIDINPPSYSGEATTFLDFPADYEVRHQDLQSNFALKIHALLCRGFLKGRDWYDFSWYVSKGVKPNLRHLQAALIQTGPWRNETTLNVDMNWLCQQLSRTISQVPWGSAKEDVRRFMRPTEIKSIDLWSEDFFLSKLRKLCDD